MGAAAAGTLPYAQPPPTRSPITAALPPLLHISPALLDLAAEVLASPQPSQLLLARADADPRVLPTTAELLGYPSPIVLPKRKARAPMAGAASAGGGAGGSGGGGGGGGGGGRHQLNAGMSEEEAMAAAIAASLEAPPPPPPPPPAKTPEEAALEQAAARAAGLAAHAAQVDDAVAAAREQASWPMLLAQRARIGAKEEGERASALAALEGRVRALAPEAWRGSVPTLLLLRAALRLCLAGGREEEALGALPVRTAGALPGPPLEGSVSLFPPPSGGWGGGGSPRTLTYCGLPGGGLVVCARDGHVSLLDPASNTLRLIAGTCIRDAYGSCCDESSGILFFADTYTHSIKAITSEWLTGSAPRVVTLAGLGGHSGAQNGADDAARFYHPVSIVLDPRSEGRDLLVADHGTGALRRVRLTGGIDAPAGQRAQVHTLATQCENGASLSGIRSLSHYCAVGDCFYLVRNAIPSAPPKVACCISHSLTASSSAHAPPPPLQTARRQQIPQTLCAR